MPSRHHTFRIPDAVWAAAITRARAEGTTVTAEVLRFLTKYGKSNPRRRQGHAEGHGGESNA